MHFSTGRSRTPSILSLSMINASQTHTRSSPIPTRRSPPPFLPLLHIFLRLSDRVSYTFFLFFYSTDSFTEHYFVSEFFPYPVRLYPTLNSLLYLPPIPYPPIPSLLTGLFVSQSSKHAHTLAHSFILLFKRLLALSLVP